MTGPQSLMIMNRSVPSGTHICAFFSGPAGRDDVVMPFLADGIRAGQKCLCVLEAPGSAAGLAPRPLPALRDLLRRRHAVVLAAGGGRGAERHRIWPAPGDG